MNQKLWRDLELLRAQLESITEDEGIKTYIKSHSKLMDKFDEILQGMEDGDYDKEDEIEK